MLCDENGRSLLFEIGREKKRSLSHIIIIYYLNHACKKGKPAVASERAHSFKLVEAGLDLKTLSSRIFTAVTIYSHTHRNSSTL